MLIFSLHAFFPHFSLSLSLSVSRSLSLSMHTPHRESISQNRARNCKLKALFVHISYNVCFGNGGGSGRDVYSDIKYTLDEKSCAINISIHFQWRWWLLLLFLTRKRFLAYFIHGVHRWRWWLHSTSKCGLTNKEVNRPHHISPYAHLFLAHIHRFEDRDGRLSNRHNVKNFFAMHKTRPLLYPRWIDVGNCWRLLQK